MQTHTKKTLAYNPKITKQPYNNEVAGTISSIPHQRS